jgi:membrane protease YdiL (CAAX protease family)
VAFSWIPNATPQFVRALRSCGASVWLSVLIVSALFAAAHLQYDAYDLSHVFVLSILLCAARVRYESIVASMAMHAVTNIHSGSRRNGDCCKLIQITQPFGDWT